MYKPDRLNASI